MTDRAKRIPDLPRVEVANPSDLVLVERKTGNTTFETSGITIEHLFTANTAIRAEDMIVTDTTVLVDSNAEMERGKFWFDSNYLYVAVSNTIVKRVALEIF